MSAHRRLLKLLPVLRWSAKSVSRTGGANAARKPMSGRIQRARSGRATRRGSGTTVSAAIMICDLVISPDLRQWPRDYVIDLLNGYFDAMSEPIARHGGEILNYRRRSARHFSAQPAVGLRKSAACRGRSPAGMVALNEKNGETVVSR